MKFSFIPTTRFLSFAIISTLACFLPQTGKSQSLFDEMIINGETVNISKNKETKPDFGPQILEVDSTLDVENLTMTQVFFMPPIFDKYNLHINSEAFNPLEKEASTNADTEWMERINARNSRLNAFRQNFMISHPELIRYNMATMPRPPKEFKMTVDPTQTKITVEEFSRDKNELKQSGSVATKVDRIDWLHNFDGSLQFSQAYLSPNWYQGGNSNLNMIANILYNIKLNQKFHPNLIFEASVAYKLGLNNAPDDSVHSYNISEDLLQINTKFGVKAAKRWYYSVTAQFKTQLLNNYKKNSHDLAAAFLSPGELNIGIGMTYSYENPRKTVNFNASIAPFSYNLKTCTNSKLDPTGFGIEEGHTSISQYGSNAELTLNWKISYNIEYFSRLFIFTNYEYVQADWENTISFNINKFLSTKLYAHLRYESNAQPIEGTKWNKWQFKEILSIGFAYKFSQG